MKYNLEEHYFKIYILCEQINFRVISYQFITWRKTCYVYYAHKKRCTDVVPSGVTLAVFYMSNLENLIFEGNPDLKPFMYCW